MERARGKGQRRAGVGAEPQNRGLAGLTGRCFGIHTPHQWAGATIPGLMPDMEGGGRVEGHRGPRKRHPRPTGLEGGPWAHSVGTGTRGGRGNGEGLAVSSVWPRCELLSVDLGQIPQPFWTSFSQQVCFEFLNFPSAVIDIKDTWRDRMYT